MFVSKRVGKRRQLTIGSAGLALILMTLIRCTAATPAEPAITFSVPTSTRPPLGDVYTAAVGTLSQNLELRGAVKAQQDAELFFAVDGRVKQVHVDPGTRVRAGDLVAELDASNLRDRVETLTFTLQQSELGVEHAQTEVDAKVDVFWAKTAVGRAQVTAAQAQVERQRAEAAQAAQEGRTVYVDESGVPLAEAQLNLTQAAAQVEVDAARSRLALVELSRDQTEARLVDAREQLSQTLLTAPIDGKVQSLSVNAGAGVQAYETVGMIVDPSDLWVSALASAGDVQQIEIGQAVSVRFELNPGQTYEGVVRDVAAQSNSASYEVVVDFEQPELVPSSAGDNVRVILPGIVRSEVLIVPNEAITTFAGQTYVQVVTEDETILRTEIETGITDGAFTEVVSGLEPGQVVKLP